MNKTKNHNPPLQVKWSVPKTDRHDITEILLKYCFILFHFLVDNPVLVLIKFVYQGTSKRQRYQDEAFMDRSKECRSSPG
jgi:hypothetical protein